MTTMRGSTGMKYFVQTLMGLAITALLAAGVLTDAQPAWADREAAEAAPRPELKIKPVKEGQAPGLTSTALDTSTDVDTLIGQAQEFADEEQYRQAIIVLQQVAEKWPTKVTTQDHRTYYPVRREVERLIASMPTEALELYRLMTDGEARALLETDPSQSVDVDALGRLVDQYFLTSLGDEAALRLASLLMDRGRYHVAASLLSRILTEYPDPTVPRAEAQARLAVAYARMGDLASAERELDRIDPASLPASRQRWAGIRAQLNEAVAEAGAAPAGQWSMRLGGPTRRQAMPGLWDGAIGSGKQLWVSAWTHEFERKAPKDAELPSRLQHYYRNANKRNKTRAQTQRRWAQYGWTPAGNLSIADGRVYYKTHNRIVCRDVITGSLVWEMEDGRAFPSEYDSNQNVRVTAVSYSRQGGESDEPDTPEEVLMFADDVGKGVAVVDGVAYHVEHNYRSSVMQSMGRANVQYTVDGRGLGNRLIGWDAATGKLRLVVGPMVYLNRADDIFEFRREPKIDQESMTHDLHVRSMPVGVNGLAIVAVEVADDLYLLALDPNDEGQIVWRTFLSSVGDIFSNHQKPVGVTVDGGDIYVAGGTGSVFCLNAVDGKVRWATLYDQSVVESNNSRFRRSMPKPVGWSENTLIAHGRFLVVTPRDAQEVLRFDRVTGQPLAGTKFGQGDYEYVVGVHEGGLLLAGPKHIRRIDLTRWKAGPTRGIAPITGRPVLAGEALLVPNKEKLVRFDPMRLKPVGSVSVVTPAGDPVGNIYTDGERIYAQGMEYVYALVDGQREIERLTEAIKKSPSADDLLARATLYEQSERPKDAVADLRRARELGPEGKLGAEIDGQLFELLLALSHEKGAETQALLAEAKPLARTAGHRTRWNLASAKLAEQRGDVVAAMQAYLSLAEEGEGELVKMEETEPGLTARANMVAMTATARLCETHPEKVTELLAELGAQALENAKKQPGQIAARVNVARMYPGTPAGVEAGWTAAQIAREKGDWERGELILIEMSRSPHPTTAAAGMAYLARYHEETGWKHQARREWLALAKKYPDTPVLWDTPVTVMVKEQVEVPVEPEAQPDADPDAEAEAEAEPGENPEAGPERASSEAGEDAENGVAADTAESDERSEASSEPTETAGEAAAETDAGEAADGPETETDESAPVRTRTRTRLVERTTREPTAAALAELRLEDLKPGPMPDYQEMPAPPWKKLWDQRNGYSYLVLPLGDVSDSEYLSHHALIFQRGKQLMLKDTSSKKLRTVWGKRISSKMNNSVMVSQEGVYFRGGRTGHVAVLAAQDEILAYGLVNPEGNALWSTKAPQANKQRYNVYQLRNYAKQGLWDIDVGDGVAAIRYDHETYGAAVKVIDVGSGDVLWWRHFDQQEVEGVKMVGGSVAVMLNNRSEIVSFDRFSGRELGRHRLRNVSNAVPLIWTDDGLFYQNSKEAFYLNMPKAKLRWSRRCVGWARGFGKIDAERGYWISPDNAVEILNLEDGRSYDFKKKKWVNKGSGTLLGRERGEDRLHNINDVGINHDTGELYAVGMGIRGERMLGVFHVETGKRVTTIDFGRYFSFPIEAQTLADAGDVIPWVEREMDPKRRNRPTGKMVISFYDKASGKKLKDAKLPNGQNGRFQNMFTPPTIVGNVMFVGTHREVQAFGRDPDATTPPLKSRDEGKADENKPQTREAEPDVEVEPADAAQQRVKRLKQMIEQKRQQQQQREADAKDEDRQPARGGVKIRINGIQIQGGGGAQRIQIKNGKVIINGQEVEIDPNDGPIQIRDGEVKQGDEIIEKLKKAVEDEVEEAEK